MDAQSYGFDVREVRHHAWRWEHRLTRDEGEPMPRMSKTELFTATRRDLAAGMSGADAVRAAIQIGPIGC